MASPDVTCMSLQEQTDRYVCILPLCGVLKGYHITQLGENKDVQDEAVSKGFRIYLEIGGCTGLKKKCLNDM